MAPVANERKKKKKTNGVAAEMAERIVAAALTHPILGADRLARLLSKEGVEVSRGLVYRTLRGRSLQTRQLRVRSIEEARRLGQQSNSSVSEEAPVPLPEPFREQLQGPPRPLGNEPSIKYPTLLAPDILPAPEKDKPEAPAIVAPAFISAPSGTSRLNQIEKARLGKEKWLFRGINLLLSVLMVFIGIRIGVSLYDEGQESSVAATFPSSLDSTSEAADPAGPRRPLSDYRVIIARNLFGSANEPDSDAARETAEIKAIGLAGNEVGLKLIGTAVSKDRRLNYAVLEIIKTRNQEIGRENERVANVLIRRIYRNNVIILTDTGEMRLSVDEKPPSGTAASMVQPAAAAMNFPEIPRVDIENTGAKFEISREDITHSLPGLRQMLGESNSSANLAEGKPDGFSVGRLRSRDAFFRIGLRTGDVIKSVDGEAVNSIDDAELLIDRLAEGGDFSIMVERRGQLESLNLTIK
jgi:type II secretory pathway component PulC